MRINAKILRIFLKEGDKYEGKVMYKYIVSMLKKEGISGATVYRGIYGYGVRGISDFDIFRLSINLPVVIECVDIEENINKVLPKLYEIIKENGLIVITDGYVYKGENYEQNVGENK
ncbi:conserved protein of unknown function [Methanocaldococcus lauensis]|uniref:Uncharacterized protein n=1 Tax=Methanocaldococcus lauensis TaxID=2546128 RepID=A0A8D6SUS4_9EURY|nr:DUF190 domain-containing protein [Methanocaldococcus lauensis]CAB3287604.1 conserved protein of unknown function [Methanocaldococcus lauensis]CAB3289882.1 conserved protein of unknown function [Methanocaldococcus lauensis]